MRMNTKIAAALAAGLIAGAAAAQEPALPASITLSAYDTGSNGFNQAVAIGGMLKKRYSTDVRVLPAGNDIARLAPLKAGRANASAMGIGTFFAQEGVFEFANPDWGPQAVQLILSSSSCNGQSLGAAADVGIKTAADLKGKRAGFVVGSPAVNQSMLAFLAFGGWTTKEVRAVEFASYGAMMKGVVNGEIDLFFASTISGLTKEIDSSPRGVMWVPMPASDTAGWERMKKVGPYFYPHKATCGPQLSPEKPVETSVYPYPIFMAYASQDTGLIHALTRAMLKHYDDYKDSVAGVDGLEGKRQNLQWSMPYHAGAVKALAEAGIWNAAADKHNQGLLKRQAVLAAAWKSFIATRPPSDKDQFRDAWMKARAAALRADGLDVLFE
ncbi:TAXI family TRAP transporter solute-binding subunit [Quisquiliibacterium transsilvanicum]|uniref:TRAP transporter TAXI family solute receptor n=1 Tax=Quisquiliibacterium transsilvanicum TaxID=1549638 RepID=A0A7W8M872_9BURK|nr:TAXI family TRAP transporter solute-binding subunit [Quisquiliibacterium transsilvanicum]MBB5270955.1 TRAP transporter TAXI family solute receptor [Quisquiliibacterium transsilvanicum]